MKTHVFCLFFLVLQVFATSVLALEIRPPGPIGKLPCIRQDINTVHKELTNYASYSGIDDRVRANNEPVAIAIDMTQSRVTKTVQTKTEKGSNFFVYFELQPKFVSDPKLFPRFTLNCTSVLESPSKLVHKCKLVTTSIHPEDNIHFALNGFSSRVEVNQLPETSGCNLTLDYLVTIDSNSEQIQQIFDATPMYLVDWIPYVSDLYEESVFLQKYYESFYTTWIDYVATRKPSGN